MGTTLNTQDTSADPRANTTRLSFVSRLRDGTDGRSWVSFHRYYGELLYGYARRLGASHEMAEDVVQEVEMYVFKAIGGFRHRARRGCFRAYLRTAVVHALARQARLEVRREASLDPAALDALSRDDPMDDPIWQRARYLDRLRWALRSIAREFDPVTLEAFQLYSLDNRPGADVAELLGISRESVYQAKSRILRRLRQHMTDGRLADQNATR